MGNMSQGNVDFVRSLTKIFTLAAASSQKMVIDF